MAGVFLAAGHNGQRALSRDGREWRPPTLGQEGEICRGAAIGAGKLVTVGTRGGDQLLAYSADGAEWKQTKREGGYGGYVRAVSFLNGKFIALGGDPGSVGAANPYVIFSDDGETWSANQPIGGKFMLRRIAFGGGKYVGVGDRGRRAHSDDARKWTDIEKVKPLETLVDIAFGAGIFVGVGLHGLRMTTADGAAWSEPLVGEEGEHLNTILWADDHFVAIGAGVTFLSPDGTTWERKANVNAPLVAAYGDKTFVGAKWRGRLLRSTDGITWEETLKAEQPVEAVAFGGL